MTDLEMTRLCAEAMGYEIGRAKYQPHWQVWVTPPHDTQSLPSQFLYDPLHDDVQAMALVKKMELNILRQKGGWTVFQIKSGVGNVDLNRAIVECVAKMRAAA